MEVTIWIPTFVGMELVFFQIIFYFQWKEGFGEAEFAGRFRRNHGFVDHRDFCFFAVEHFQDRCRGFTEFLFVRNTAGEVQFVTIRCGLLQFILIDFLEHAQIIIQFPGSNQASSAGQSGIHASAFGGRQDYPIMTAAGTFSRFTETYQIADIEAQQMVPIVMKRRYQNPAQRRAAVFFFQRLEIHTAKLSVLVEFTGFALHEDITRFGGAVGTGGRRCKNPADLTVMKIGRVFIS